jgi:hypothetical protein
MARISGSPARRAVVGARPTLTVPVSRACCAARAACSAWRSASCASRKNAMPASVGVTPLAVRCSSRVLKLALKPADLLAQRRLHQVQVQRRAADAAEFDHPHKIPQLPQFHGRSAL